MKIEFYLQVRIIRKYFSVFAFLFEALLEAKFKLKDSRFVALLYLLPFTFKDIVLTFIASQEAIYLVYPKSLFHGFLCLSLDYFRYCETFK